MTTPGDRPRRSGFLANLSTALTPPVVTEDDPDTPLVPSTSVKVATVLVALAGALFLFLGINQLVQLDDSLDLAVTQYNEQIDKCTTEVGGIGEDNVQAPADDASEEDKNFAEWCKQASPLTDEMIDGARSRATIIGWVLNVIGAAALVAGWFLRTGVPWARRVTVGLVVLTMIGTMFLQISNMFTMIATLLLVAAVVMCYLGKGGVYFARVALRRRTS